MQTAANVGCPCLSCTWGFRTREELQAERAQYLAADAAELEQIILRGPEADAGAV